MLTTKQQQARFDDFLEVFHYQRPHEALHRQCPAEVYRPSPRSYQGLPDIDYPLTISTQSALGRPDRNREEGLQYAVGQSLPGREHALPKGQETDGIIAAGVPNGTDKTQTSA